MRKACLLCLVKVCKQRPCGIYGNTALLKTERSYVFCIKVFLYCSFCVFIHENLTASLLYIHFEVCLHKIAHKSVLCKIKIDKSLGRRKLHNFSHYLLGDILTVKSTAGCLACRYIDKAKRCLLTA